ncbi:MAG: calcium-binding protein [Planctomycetaceae bacterium]
MVLDNSGTLLSIESTDFADGADDVIQLTAGTNAVIGGAGNDQITAGSGSNTILGDDGKATFFANGDLQTIESTNGGNGGDDTINLSSGINAVIGGSGNDSITATTGTNTILGDEGQAEMFADGTLKLITSTNPGVGGSDSITLTDGTNTVIAGAGDDTIGVGSGNNFVFGDEGRREAITSGPDAGTTVVESLNGLIGGKDTLTVGSGYNVVAGGANEDSITVNGTTPDARGIVLGDNGRLVIATISGVLLSIESAEFTGGASDSIVLTAGINAVIGGAGNDSIKAGSGSNTILGDDGKATFFANGDLHAVQSINLGNGGNDTIHLSDGINSVIAGAGNDSITVGTGFNLVLGDEGEALLFSDGTVDEIRSLNSGVGGTDTIDLGSGTNVVIAGAASDTVTVGSGSSIILGDEGQRIVSRDGFGTITGTIVETINDAVGADDSIEVSGGHSLVMGGAGSDTITGIDPTNTDPPPVMIVAGDAAQAEYDDAGVLRVFFTKSPAAGAADVITLASAGDIVFGGAGNDIISAGDGRNLIVGDNGQAIFSSAGILTSLVAIDTTFGGDDVISSGSGDDIVIAGSGADSVTITGGDNLVLGDNGMASFATTGQLLELISQNLVDGGNDVISTGSGNDTVVAGTGADTVTSTGGNNHVLGDSGRITVDLTGILRAVSSIDDISGDIDTIQTGSGNDIILGGELGDSITSTGGNNIVLGDFGDLIFDLLGILTQTITRNVASFGDDSITTGGGDDLILGGAGSDTIDAGNGNNIVVGDFADVRSVGSRLVSVTALEMGSGHADSIVVGSGHDTVMAGDGADTITSTDGNNLLIGDHAILTWHTNGRLQKADSTSPGVGDNDTIQSGNGRDIVIAGFGDDQVTLADGNNIVVGDNGEVIFDDTGILRELRTTSPAIGGTDTIHTGNGSDMIPGGAAGDSIHSSGGNNLVLGDHGEALHDAAGTLISLHTTQPTIGGDDTITTGTGNDLVFGSVGSDSIHTSGGNNLLLGDAGSATWDSAGNLISVATGDASTGAADDIQSGSGNDIVLGGDGSDVINAGDGNNIIAGDHASADFHTNGTLVRLLSTGNAVGGDDQITTGSGDDVVVAGTGADTVVAGDGNNVIIGDSADVSFRPDGTREQIDSTTPTIGGNDIIQTGSGNDAVIAGFGDDTLTVAAGNNLLLGDNGQLIFDAGGLWSAVESTATDIGGNDSISSGSGSDTIIGGTGSDTVSTTGGNNIISGDNAHLQILPSEQRFETIAPNFGGQDHITSAAGSDIIFGGNDNDTIDAGDGNNIVFGDHGFIVQNPAGDLVDLQSTDFTIGGADRITTGTDRDMIVGGTSADTIHAGNGSNVIFGDHGRIQQNSATLQTITSLAEDVGDGDTINAGNGTTVAIGGFGSDTVTIGDGTNTVFGDNASATRNDQDQLLTADTLFASIGDADTIAIGSGTGVVFGGAAGDSITATGGRNLLLGDHGTATFDGAGQWLNVSSTDDNIGGNDTIQSGTGNDLAIGGFGADAITLNDGSNVATGDNASAVFDAAGQLRTLVTQSPDLGDADVISTGSGSDLILGGASGDTVDAGDGRNVVLGDHGTVTLNAAGQWTDVTSTDVTFGGDDVISSGIDDALIIGGLGSDQISAVGGDNLILGDHGQATLNAAGFLLAVQTLAVSSGATDSIRSGSGGDVILGGAGGDVIDSGDGRGVVMGDHGSITFDGAGQWVDVQATDPGEGGDDQITSGDGMDLIIAGTGSDTISAGNADNTVIGDNGSLTLNSAGQLLTISGTFVTDGDRDVITTGDNTDIILGGTGDDQLNAGHGTNVIIGDHADLTFDTPGQWTRINSTAPSIGGDDVIAAGSGRDVVIGGFGSDTITTGNGDNVVLGDHGDAAFDEFGQLRHITTTQPTIGDADHITTGSDTDLILGGASADVIDAGNGRSVVIGDHGSITLNAAGQWLNVDSSDTTIGGDDTISTGDGQDVILGGSGNDLLNAGNGHNTVLGDHGSATFNAAGFLLNLSSVAPADGGNDTITTGADTDLVIGGAGNDVIDVGDGRNVILGDSGLLNFDGSGQWTEVRSTDFIIGGNDQITSGSGPDLAVGGIGNDTMHLNDGDNTAAGDNATVTLNSAGFLLNIASTATADGGTDEIVTGSGSDIIVGGTEADQLHAAEGNNVIVGDSGDITFDGAGQWLNIATTATDIGGNDTITAGSDNDVVFGGASADSVTISGGNNVVVGDNGLATFNAAGQLLTIISTSPHDGDDDEVRTGSGRDIIVGGTGSDRLNAADGNNVVIGDHAELLFATPDQWTSITSSATDIGGNDEIITGSGNDFAVGGFGADSITLGEGDNTAIGDNGLATFNAVGQLNTIQTTDANIGAADVIRAGSGSDIVLAGAAGDDVNVSDGRNVVIADHGAIIINDAGQWTDIRTTDTAIGGDDVITTGLNDDAVFGGIGNDRLTLNDGRNLAFGDNGHATFNADGFLLTAESLAAADGGKDAIFTGIHSDIIIAGTTDDTIHAGEGNNAVIGDSGRMTFDGAGQWLIVETTDTAIGGNDSITTGDGNDLVLGGAGADNMQLANGDNVALGDNGQATFNTAGHLLSITSQAPADGDADTVNTGSGRDIVIGGTAGDQLHVGEGTNVIIGDHAALNFDGNGQWINITSNHTNSGGNDQITAGNGNDIALGGTGNDTISLGDGINAATGDHGHAEFNTAGQLLLIETTAPGDGGNDRITTGIDQDIVLGGDGDDIIHVSDGRNTVVGDHGQATFYSTGIRKQVTTTVPSNGGNDRIVAGSGNDVALGGIGADDIRLAEGDNVAFGDTGMINGNAAGFVTDLREITSGFGDDDTIITGSGTDLIIGGDHDDAINSGNGKNVVLGDHGLIELNDVGQWKHVASSSDSIGGHDTISTGIHDDVVIGGTGNDIITAGEGSNLVIGDNGDITFNDAGQLLIAKTQSAAEAGADRITTGNGTDVIFGGSDSDNIAAGNGRNVVVGDNGRIVFNGQGQWLNVTTTDVTIGGNDSIITGSGTDVIFGGFADDSIDAAAGNNTVIGDNGTATFDAGGQIRSVATHSPTAGGDDTIKATSGEDLVLGGVGSDHVDAGQGRNVVIGDNGSITLNAAGQWINAATSNSVDGGDDTILTGDALDLIFGGYGSDQITAGHGQNTIFGDNGLATLNAAGFLLTAMSTQPADGGDDVISTGQNTDIVLAGSGSDHVDVSDGRNVVIGDSGEITFDGAGQWLNVRTTAASIGGHDVILTGKDLDVVFGGFGNDNMSLSDGKNVAAGDNAAATFNTAGQILTVTTTDPGHAGHDTISTGVDNDVVLGGTGNDIISAGEGRNVIVGDNGNATFDVKGQIRTVTTSDSPFLGHDTISSGSGSDLVFGGSGRDAISIAGGNNFVLGDNGQAELDASGFVTRLESLTPAVGDADQVQTGDGQDLIIGGTAGDRLDSGAGNDLIFGDHARIEGHLDLNNLPLNSRTPSFTFTSIATQTTDNGGNDVILAGSGDDIAIGGQGHDRIVGGAGNDDLIGGHNVANGDDGNDTIDGGTGHDVIAGDNASILRNPRTDGGRWRVLSGTEIYAGDGTPLVTGKAQEDPNAVPLRDITIFNHTVSTASDVYGHDNLAGGAGDDLVFGQLGNDSIQGDGSVLDKNGLPTLLVMQTQLSVDDFAGPGSDGDDYIEGGGGQDLIFGNQGQDDIVGGSSSMFGTPTADSRPDAQDIIFGASGTAADRNSAGDESPAGHAHDADVILGDNGNIYRLVGIRGSVGSGRYLSFTYDMGHTETVIPRAIEQLDYAAGQTSDVTLSDVIHGEAGDDIIWGMSGNDVLFGDGQDDDLIGGSGSDRIYGGSGVDGILGDDGRIFTSRNGFTEALHGLTQANVQYLIDLPGTLIGSANFLTGKLLKSVDLYAYDQGGNDIIYGGLGDDFIHGGAGDDAISGAEALETHFHTALPATASVLNYNASQRKFADYNAEDALSRIDGFLLNFDATDATGHRIDDGIDSIFGDLGNDWIVGGTMNDRLFGGMGDDLLNADDNLFTNGGLNNIPGPGGIC